MQLNLYGSLTGELLLSTYDRLNLTDNINNILLYDIDRNDENDYDDDDNDDDNENEDNGRINIFPYYSSDDTEKKYYFYSILDKNNNIKKNCWDATSSMKVDISV